MIEEKLQRYQDALDKHGAQTRHGALAFILTAATGMAATSSDTLGSAGVVASLGFVGGISLVINSINNNSKDELKGEGLREMAWLYEFHRKPFLQRFKDWFS